MNHSNQNMAGSQYPQHEAMVAQDTVQTVQPPQPNKIRRIQIEPLNKGYVVTVGCQSVAVSTKSELIEKLVRYINEPEKTENAYYANELFKD